MRLTSVAATLLVARVALSQQIFDSWTTTWDRQSSLGYKNAGQSPVNFVATAGSADADITVDDSQVFQQMTAGFGGSLTDSSATVLNNMKSANSQSYWKLLNTMYNPNDNMTSSAGFTFIRVPLGASDFSAKEYTFNDASGDSNLSKFNINAAPTPLFSVLKDIVSINSILKVQVLPWSMPGWAKDSNSMNGGSFNKDIQMYANYLLKSVQGFKSQGIPVYMVGIQNEPENNNPTYPSTKMDADQMAQIGTALRSLLDKNNLRDVKIIGYEHNWNHATAYPADLISKAGNAFAGVAFHCYAGNVSQQSDFHKAHSDKEIYFTECAGTLGSDYWQDIKWAMDNLVTGAVENFAQSVAYWNIALDGKGQPILQGSNSCGGGGCRGIATVNSDGSYSLNQEFYAMAQGSKAIIPKDAGGPMGQRIGVSVSGGSGWGLRVMAYKTERTNKSDWNRYSITVLNWNDNSSSKFNPQSIKANIHFRGQHASYTFPVGVTTLTWYAAPK